MIVTIDGIDRTGKDTLHRYIENLAKFRYVINTRGILTQLAYNRKFNRDYTYNLDEYKKDPIIFLYAEPEDLAIRFKMTKEPKLSDKPLEEGIKDDLSLFFSIIKELEEKGFIIFTYNTSELTPYTIAKNIVEELNKLEVKGDIIV